MRRYNKTVHVLCFFFLQRIRIQRKYFKELSSQYSFFQGFGCLFVVVFVGFFLDWHSFVQETHSSLMSTTFQQHSDSTTQNQWFKKKKALSYKIRSISSVLLIKSYFNIKYSYSILYTSFSLLAEYCYWLVKQKNFNHFALRCFGGTIWFPAATLITVMGEKEKKREKQGGKCSKKSILGYKVGWKRGSFSECKDWSHSVEHETPHSLVFPLENSPSYTASHSRALFLPSMKPFPL